MRLVKRNIDSNPSSQRIANASTQRNNNTEIDYTQPLAALHGRHVGEARLGDRGASL
jgi:hypothetical protein